MAESTRNKLHSPIVERASLEFDDFPMTMLETAVRNQDVIAFQSLVEEISWSNQSPLDLVKTIRMALVLEAPLIARKLAEQGAKSHPQNQELSKIARILAPPELVVALNPRDLGVKENNNWINAHRKDYYGKWVALKNGELLETGQTFTELRAKVGNIKGKGILVTQVT